MCSDCSGRGEKLREKDQCVKLNFFRFQVLTLFSIQMQEVQGQEDGKREDASRNIRGTRYDRSSADRAHRGGGRRGVSFRSYLLQAMSLGFLQPGIPPGDVIFVLRARPHRSFERSGNDLLTKVHITLSEALLGFSRIILTHLDGRGIHVSSIPGRIYKSGDSIMIRGEGMPIYKSPDQKGQLYVMFEVDMPDEEWLKTIDPKVGNDWIV